MKTSLQNIHCVLEKNPAWAASPLPYEDGTDSSVYSTVDWEPLLTQYHKGDKQVFQLLCCQSRPLVDRISRNPYYATALGRDEAYSIAAMAMVNFWNRTDLTENPKNLPGQLYHAMECDLKTRWTDRTHGAVGKSTTKQTGEQKEPTTNGRTLWPSTAMNRRNWFCRRSGIEMCGTACNIWGKRNAR